jgi:hypothetical protein
MRAVIAALSLLMLALFAATLLPEREVALPDTRIALTSARVLLYPTADPRAEWTFLAPSAVFDPNEGTTELFAVEDAHRAVDGVIDFTLRADRLFIDRSDDLIAERIEAHLLADGWDVLMERRGERNVLVRQETGRFEVPHVEIRGDGIGESIYQDMRITFDFTDFEAGGPGTVGTSSFVADATRPMEEP